jgi:hypothetical protein
MEIRFGQSSHQLAYSTFAYKLPALPACVIAHTQLIEASQGNEVE